MDGRGIEDAYGWRCANDRAVWFSSRRDESPTLTLEWVYFEGTILGKKFSGYRHRAGANILGFEKAGEEDFGRMSMHGVTGDSGKKGLRSDWRAHTVDLLHQLDDREKTRHSQSLRRMQKCRNAVSRCLNSCPNSSLASLIVEPQVCPCLLHRSIKANAATYALLYP